MSSMIRRVVFHDTDRRATSSTDGGVGCDTPTCGTQTSNCGSLRLGLGDMQNHDAISTSQQVRHHLRRSETWPVRALATDTHFLCIAWKQGCKHGCGESARACGGAKDTPTSSGIIGWDRATALATQPLCEAAPKSEEESRNSTEWYLPCSIGSEPPVVIGRLPYCSNWRLIKKLAGRSAGARAAVSGVSLRRIPPLLYLRKVPSNGSDAELGRVVGRGGGGKRALAGAGAGLAPSTGRSKR